METKDEIRRIRPVWENWDSTPSKETAGVESIDRVAENVKRCSHVNWVIIFGREPSCFKKEKMAYNYFKGVRQDITAWCTDCGSLKINREWILPGEYGTETLIIGWD